MAERSDELLKHMLAAAGRAYNYFREERSQRVQASFESEPAPTSPPYDACCAQSGAQRPVSVWQRKEVQEMLRERRWRDDSVK